MSLQDDIKTVYSALKGSSDPDWPEPEPDDPFYHGFEAFRRICDQIPEIKKAIRRNENDIL